MKWKKLYAEMKDIATQSIDEAYWWRGIAIELQAQLNAAKEMNTENLRLLDSYMQNNSRQAQDIIELEAVAIALYDVLWHMVYSVEDEIKDKNVTNLNAYKTIVALFEAEGED